MFEIGIFCVIFLAASYWAVLWTMGRREDVLHGEFVEHDAQSDEPAQSAIPKPPARRIFLDRPVFPERPCDRSFPSRLSDLSGPPFRINRRFDRNGWSRC